MNLWSIKESFYREDLLSHLPLEKICILTCTLKQHIAITNASHNLHEKEHLKFKCYCLLDESSMHLAQPSRSLNPLCETSTPGVPASPPQLPYLPAQVSNQAPALSNESPISKHGSPFPLSGIPSHLLGVSIHPIYPSNCNLPLTPSLLAWVIILNYWQGDCIVWTFIYGKLIYWAPFIPQAEDSVLRDYIYIYLSTLLPGG